MEEFFTSPDELPAEDSVLDGLDDSDPEMEFDAPSPVHLSIHTHSILFTIGMRMEHNRVKSSV